MAAVRINKLCDLLIMFETYIFKYCFGSQVIDFDVVLPSINFSTIINKFITPRSDLMRHHE